MKIECAWNDGVPFKNVKLGDCFMFEGKLFMKVSLICAIDESDDGADYNAIDLATGYWYGICDIETVIPIDGKFVVNP